MFGISGCVATFLNPVMRKNTASDEKGISDFLLGKNKAPLRHLMDLAKSAGVYRRPYSLVRPKIVEGEAGAQNTGDNNI